MADVVCKHWEWQWESVSGNLSEQLLQKCVALHRLNIQEILPFDWSKTKLYYDSMSMAILN